MLARSERGSLLSFTLVVVTLALLLAGALLLTGKQAGRSVVDGERGVQNEALAKGCVNRLLQNLQYDQAYQTDLDWVEPDQEYHLSFDTSQPLYSTNNLGGGLAQASSINGQVVPAGVLEAIVTVRTGVKRNTYRFLLGKGRGTLASVGANGAIHFGHDVTLDSIDSLKTRNPVDFAVVSNSVISGITYNVNPGTFTVTPEAKMRSAGTVAPGILSAFPNRADVQEQAPPQPLPDVDVQTIVNGQSGLSAPPLLGSTVVVHDDHYSNSSMTVNGSIDLSDGALYIEGDLTVNGAITGYGSVFATGDVTINGGSAVVFTNARSGAAVYSGGDITFTGLSAADYLDSLAATHSGLDAAWTQFQAGYNFTADLSTRNPLTYPGPPANMDSVLGPRLDWLYTTGGGFPSADTFDRYRLTRDLFWGKMILGAGQSANNSELLPRPGPNGWRTTWHDDGYARRVRDELRTLPGAGVDPRLDHLVQAFEEIGYIFRHDWSNSLQTWDSPIASYLPGEISFDQILWLVNGYRTPDSYRVPSQPQPEDYGGVFSHDEELARQNFVTLFQQNPPLDFSWLGRSYFQGVLYAQQNITLENDATILGAVSAGGDLNLTDGTQFTYNREYESVFQNGTGPVRVTSYSKI